MKPFNIFLIRHGESEGNVNKEIYKTIPDYALNLTDKGRAQALESALQLQKAIGHGRIAAYYSPYFRARQTCDIVLGQFPRHQIIDEFVKEESRIREQEWCGKLREDGFMHEAEAERDSYGHTYYRFDGGESCLDTFDRISDMIGALHRDFEKPQFPENLCIFGHGMGNRLFLMKWFHLSVEQFEMLANPKNCEVWHMQLDGPYIRFGTPEPNYKLLTSVKRYEETDNLNIYPFSPKNSITRFVEAKNIKVP